MRVSLSVLIYLRRRKRDLEVTMSGFPHGPGYREDDPDLLLAIALSKSLMVRARHADGVRAGRQRPVPRPEANAPRLRR